MVEARRLLCLLSILFPLSLRAEILFEGYAKILSGGMHIGYIVQRYEYDSKKKEFTGTYFLKTSTTGGNVTESLRARATEALKPLSYSYTSLTDNKPRTIDAEVKGDTMTVRTSDGKAPQTKKVKLPKGAFFSNFLVYLMLQGKSGLKTGSNYVYKAVAEEDGAVYDGEAFVKEKEVYQGFDTFKVLNSFKGTRFIANVTAKGETISTRSPVLALATELVPTQAAAIGTFSFNTSTVSQLFGNVPSGRENPVAKRAAASISVESKEKTLKGPPATELSTEPGAAKKEGVEAGTGLIIKAAPSPAK